MKKGKRKIAKKNKKSFFAKLKEKRSRKRAAAEESNVQKVNFRKKNDTMGKLSKLKKIRLIAAAAVLVFLITGVFLFIEGFKVRFVTVEGSTHYTADEIRGMVITDKLSENSLFLRLKYKNKKIEDIPFVEHMDVQIKDRNTVRIIVYEKAIAGYVTYLENRMYFDKDGIVVESSKEVVPGVPEITGLEFDHVILHEALPVENPKIFKEILSLTQLLNKNSLTADRIYFDHLGNITMYFGDIRVDLGDGSYLDERVTHLAAILKEAEPRHIKGRLHMESFTISNPKTTFEVEE